MSSTSASSDSARGRIAAHGVDDVRLVRPSEGRLLDAPDRVAIVRSLLTDRDHPRESAGASPAGISW